MNADDVKELIRAVRDDEKKRANGDDSDEPERLERILAALVSMKMPADLANRVVEETRGD